MRTLFTPLALAVLCSLAPPAPAQSAEVAAPAKAMLTLAQAQRLALTHNPELAGARLELQAMEAAEQQAGARPNPELGLLVEDLRSSTRTSTLQWAQPIELGGKRAARLAAAASAREQAGVALLSRQAELRAAVAGAFFELLGAQQQARLLQASLDVARNATSVAAKRLQAGKVPPLEQAKAQVAEAAVRAELAQAQSDLLLARQRLAALWGPGQLAHAYEQADGDAQTLPEPPSEQRLGELLSRAPAIRLAQLEIARRQALAAGERAKRVPDLTLTLGARRAAEQGRTQAVLGLAIPLPIMDSNQGHLLEALRREDQAREALSATSARLQTELSQALEKLRLSRQQVQMLRSELLPTAQAAHDAAVKGYELGKFAFLDVLDAQRTLFQAQQQILRGTADAWRAAAELERLLGQDPSQAQQSQE
ncbi:TolC family protein [Paucibacter soli]|uniref:TolC family protein n=1 Tax=Paucibacter soli TaxID=3133433 RepID=UPI0030B557DA